MKILSAGNDRFNYWLLYFIRFNSISICKYTDRRDKSTNLYFVVNLLQIVFSSNKRKVINERRTYVLCMLSNIEIHARCLNTYIEIILLKRSNRLIIIYPVTKFTLSNVHTRLYIHKCCKIGDINQSIF